MSEPVRYLDGDREGLGPCLLAAAEHDGPDARSVQRALAAAAALGSVTIATSTATAGATSALVWLKWLAAGAVAGGVTATAASALFDAPSRSTPVALPNALPLESARAQPALTVPPPAPAPTITALPARSAAVPVASSEADRPSETPSDTLGEELRRIDAARRRQAAGDARGALAELDRYRQDFPHPRFADEAALVRAESLVSQGDCGGALGLARPGSHAGVLSRRWNALRQRCR